MTKNICDPLLLWVVWLGVASTSLPSAGENELPGGMSLIPMGEYQPLFPLDKSKKVRVSSFYLDKTPVTNQDFLSFVINNPGWKKSNRKPVFADKNYLLHWKTDTQLENLQLSQSPVTYVSWFAAKAYCQWRGKSLPSVDQWEYSAAASEVDPKGTDNIQFRQTILNWYSLPTPDILPPVATNFKNVWGVYDQHGLIWEWTKDFNTALVTGESRGDSSIERQLYCGSGSSGASDFNDYAAFMRYGFRSSLQGHYSVANLGFRCAVNRQSTASEPK